MEKLKCPQCGISNFYLENESGDRRLVYVSFEKEIIPSKEGENLEGFNTEIIHCLGCSWKGSINQLVKYFK